MKFWAGAGVGPARLRGAPIPYLACLYLSLILAWQEPWCLVGLRLRSILYFLLSAAATQRIMWCRVCCCILYTILQ